MKTLVSIDYIQEYWLYPKLWINISPLIEKKICGTFILGLFSSNKAYCKHKGRVPRFQTLFLYPHFPSLPRVSCYCLPISPTKWKHCLATSILFWMWSSEEHIVKTKPRKMLLLQKNVTHWKKNFFLPISPNSVEFV